MRKVIAIDRLATPDIDKEDDAFELFEFIHAAEVFNFACNNVWPENMTNVAVE